MKISVIGSGYVGLVTGACFAEVGNTVICVYIDQTKIENLKKGILPIYEPGLKTLVEENLKKETLFFTTELAYAVKNSDICFIAVGTPMGQDGSADLKYVLQVAQSIGETMDHHMYVVDKSTVPVGTAEKVNQKIADELKKRNLNISFDVISNPEFLKEGAAIDDFMKPDRVVIGASNDKALEVMHTLYQPFIQKTDRFIAMDIRSAEMTKYAANAMLATKISFINEMANICERVGADVNKVRVGIGSDSRIGNAFIYPGVGYGGSCFPKDVRALVKISRDSNYEPEILNAVENVNFRQKSVLTQKVLNHFGQDLKGLTLCVWGLSFKPETDDMREATSVTVINELTNKGAKIKAYDPKARHEAESFYLKDNRNVEFFDSKYSAVSGADGLILITEWKEFKSPDFEEISKRLKNKVIFDGRNQYSRKQLQQLGFICYQIGVPIL